MVIELCAVIPTLNERENIGILLDKLQSVLEGIAYEVIVVDDDSLDGTAAYVKELSQSQLAPVRALRRIGRRGLASACIEGMLATSAPYIVVMDADLQHDETILPVMLSKLKEEQLDLVVASRNIEGGSMGDFSRSRVFLSGLGRRLSGVNKHAAISDPMSGFFLVRRSYLDRIAHRLTGIGFKILLDLILSSPEPLRFGEVPYRFRSRERGQSKLDVIVGLEYLELLLDKVFGSYISVRFAIFCIVGAVGVLIHLTLLGCLLHFSDCKFLTAQASASGVAMVLNFLLNNALTYRDRRLHGAALWWGMLGFCIACSLGLAANLAVSDAVFNHGVWWPIASVIGLMFGSVWNYGVTSTTVWRRSRKTRVLRAERQVVGLSKRRDTGDLQS